MTLLKQTMVLVAGLVAFSGHDDGLQMPVAHADYTDSRDYSESKAKSQIRSLHKEFAKLDEAILEPRKVTNSSFFGSRAKNIERNFSQIADRDPSWDLSAEKQYYASIEKRWEQERVRLAKEKMESEEPDVGDWNIPAFAGAPKIPVGAPDWCEGVEVSEEDRWISKSKYSDLATNLDSDSLRRAAEQACRAPNFSKRQQWVRVWRQALANKTGASPELTSRFYTLWMSAGGRHGDSALRDETCTSYGYSAHNRGGESATKSRSSRSRGAIKRSGGGAGTRSEPEMTTSFRKATAVGLGCDTSPVEMARGNVSIDKLAWWLDRSAQPPSELVRAVYIISSVGLDIGETELAKGEDWKTDALRALGTYALVSADVERLDADKFQRELKAMNLNEWGQVMAQLTFSKAKHVGKIYSEAYREMDKGIQELAFEVPTKAFADWEILYKNNKDGMALALKVEDQFLTGRTTDIRGCHDQAHANYVKYVKGAIKGAKTLEDREAVLNDAIASVLIQTSVVCAAYEGRYDVASTLYQSAIDGKRQWRGPRFAAYWAMLERFSDIKAKDGSFPLEDNQVGFWVSTPNKKIVYAAYEHTFNKTGTVMRRAGRIKSVKKTAKGTALTFQTESWKEKVWDCVETRKIDRISSDGRIVYRKKCKQKGTKVVKSTVEPFTVPNSLAGGLKKGQFLKASVAFGNKNRIGIPLGIYKSNKQEKLLGALGVLF